ncbi:MAG: hypothetical protein CL910_16510 [Deltaproteobacteria bacterium]|nr:hypothetical protein [Deltaproteobacteria bacterium]
MKRDLEGESCGDRSSYVSTVRVRYAETDQGGVAYHSNYLHWFEVGRTEMMRELGYPYADVERVEGVLLTVVEAHLQYHRPAFYDEVLRIESQVSDVRRVRSRIDTLVRRDTDGELLCSGHVWLASVNRSGGVVRLPSGLHAALLAARPKVETQEEGKTDPAGIV